MTVYVDDMNLRAGRERVEGYRGRTARWSHLMADTHDELVAFADRLGLRPEWIQHKGRPTEHFDVTATVRERALRLGATPIPYGRAGGLLTWWKRATEDGDTAKAAELRARFLAEISAGSAT